MKIIPLSEGAFTIDQTKKFVPFDQTKDELTTRSTGSLLVEIQPFLVITSKDILLLDTGLGFNDSIDGGMQIHQTLKNAGIMPEQVTKVLISHLHKDHAGGITLERDHHLLSMPNAEYCIQRKEFEFAMLKGEPSFLVDEFKYIKDSKNVRWLEEDFGDIDGYINYQVTAAHSPHHQVFWIRDENEIVFFGGDDAPQLQQMKVRYKTKYDFNPERAMQLRQEWWKQGNEEKWTFLFYHDVKTPSFKRP